MTTPTAPPASFPGTIKVFTTKEDGEVIYGAHANEWQNEIVGVQSTLGRNPQTPAVTLPTSVPNPTTVGGRISNIENSAVWLAGNQVIGGNKEFSQQLVLDSGELLKGTLDHRPGTSARRRLGDTNGYQAKTSDGVSNADLLLQPSGGMVRRAGNLVWDAGNDGPGSGLDADTLDGYQAADFLLRTGCQLQMTANQAIKPTALNGDTYSGWVPVNFNVVTWEDTPGNGTLIFSGGVFTVPYTGLWLVDVTLSWDGPWQGARGFRVCNGNYAANTNPFTPGFTQWMGTQELVGASAGPPRWPTGNGPFNVNSIVLTSIEQTRVIYLTAGTKLRCDAFNWNDENIYGNLYHDGNNHLHHPCAMTIAQVA